MNNWIKESTRLGNLQDYELSVSGGTAKTKHYTSASYSNSEGVFHGIDYKKYQLRSNIDHEINKAVIQKEIYSGKLTGLRLHHQLTMLQIAGYKNLAKELAYPG